MSAACGKGGSLWPSPIAIGDTTQLVPVSFKKMESRVKYGPSPLVLLVLPMPIACLRRPCFSSSYHRHHHHHDGHLLPKPPAALHTHEPTLSLSRPLFHLSRRRRSSSKRKQPEEASFYYCCPYYSPTWRTMIHAPHTVGAR